MPIVPEIIVLAAAFAMLFADMFLRERWRGRVDAVLCVGGFAAALVATFLPACRNGQMFGGRFVVDDVSWWFRIVFLLTGLVGTFLSMDLLSGKARTRTRGMGHPGEYYSMLMFSVAGMMYLIAARDIVTLYVSLETATVPLFLLAAWRRDDVKSGEAGLKYVIIGTLASAFILYGLAILYGLTGQTDLGAMGRGLLTASPMFWLAAASITAGVGFKLTIVPFHLWAADVYEGAPTPVTAFLSVASKGVGLAFMFQMFFRVFGHHLGQWTNLIACLAAITMTVGNVVAIVQPNIKRFMAFSAISQAGFLIMGFLGATAPGAAAMVFYLLVYVVSNLTVFACIVWYSDETGREEIADYRGLSRTNPLMALAMMVALFSLAGIPPLSGFVGKFFLFSIASKAGLHWLVAVAAVNSTVSLYYYLRVVREMYIEPVAHGAKRIPVRPHLALTVAVLTVGVVLLGIIPHFYETINAEAGPWLVALLP